MNPLSEDEFQRLIAPWIECSTLITQNIPLCRPKVLKQRCDSNGKTVGWGKRRDELCIVNQPGQGEALCGGCTAIALLTRRIRHLVLVVALKAVYVEDTYNHLRTWDRSSLDGVTQCLTIPRLQKQFPNESHTENQPPGLSLSSPMNLCQLRQLALSWLILATSAY